jgi:hypothetical protein
MRVRGITFRLASLTLLASTLILAAIVGYNYTVSRTIIVTLAEDRGTRLSIFRVPSKPCKRLLIRFPFPWKMAD